MKEINITLKKKQIANDVLVQCNLIGRTLQKNEEMSELASEIMTPDDEEMKPAVARAMTEAFGEVKRACQRYLIKGRDTDDNRLEKINESATSGTDFGSYELQLAMPRNFNVGMTETVKSCAHRAIVDYVMKSVLSNQLADKAKEFAVEFTTDMEKLRDALRARITMMNRRPADWS